MEAAANAAEQAAAAAAVCAAAESAVECDICKGNWVLMVVCPQGHSCCSMCEELLRSKQNKCHICRGDLLLQVSVNLAALTLATTYGGRQLCENKPRGCLRVVRKGTTGYLSECPFRPVGCPNGANGCSASVLANTLDAHVETCPYALVPCTHPGCGQDVLKYTLLSHLLSCAHRPHQCLFCDETVAQGVALAHFGEDHGIPIAPAPAAAVALLHLNSRSCIVLRHVDDPLNSYVCVLLRSYDDRLSAEVRTFCDGDVAVPSYVSVAVSSLAYTVRSGVGPVVLASLETLRGALPSGGEPLTVVKARVASLRHPPNAV